MSKKIVIWLTVAAFLTPIASAQKPLHESIHFERAFLSWREIMFFSINLYPTICYEDSKYKGQIKENQDAEDEEERITRYGLGAFFWDDPKDIYFGEHRDYRNGTGIYIIGNMHNNRNVLNCPDCKIYVGGWERGEKSGTGTCYDQHGNVIYYGNFKNDKPTEKYPSSGYDSYKFQAIQYTDNTFYVGETKDEKRHGQGVICWQDGDMYYGFWKNDTRYKKHGIFICNSGITWTRTLGNYAKKINRLSKQPKSFVSIFIP